MKNILIFRVGQLGDAVVALPAIQAIRERHPDHRMVLLTDYHPGMDYVSSWDVYGPTGWFDEVIFYEPSPNFSRLLKNALVHAKRLRALAPEFVYALAPERHGLSLLRDQLFFHMLLAPRRFYGQSLWGEATVSASDEPRSVEPEWRRLLHIVDSAADARPVDISIPEAELAAADAVLNAEGLKPGANYLVMGLGSKMPAKIWPLERYIELGLRLREKYPTLKLVAVGGEQEADMGNAFRDAVGTSAFNLAGKLSIYGSAAVLQRSIAYVGNDSGVMHLAGLLGKPCVALFSARDKPGKWVPLGEGHHILRHDLECAGCMLMRCTQPEMNACLNRITVDEVFEAVDATLTSGNG